MTEFSDQGINELQQYATLHSLLLDDLRELLAEELDEENTRWIHKLVNELCVNMHREFAIEDEAGYLMEVLARFPGWQNQIERLQQVRFTLIQELESLHRQLDDPPGDARICQVIRDEFQAWVDRLSAHKQREHTLLMNAMNLDVGEGE